MLGVMLEDSSNLLWLLMCIVALGGWLRYSRPFQIPAQRTQAIRAIALIALLLFPAVSLSDDLRMDLTAPPSTRANAFLQCGFFFVRWLLALRLLSAFSFHHGMGFDCAGESSFLSRLSSNVTKRPPPLGCA